MKQEVCSQNARMKLPRVESLLSMIGWARFVLLPIFLLSFHISAYATSLSYSWPWYYQLTDTTAVLTVGEISNLESSGTSGTLRMELWAFASPFDGTQQSGYRLASHQLEPLAAGTSYSNVSTGTISYSNPPDGTWHLALLLMEWNEGWQYRDYKPSSVTESWVCTAGNCKVVHIEPELLEAPTLSVAIDGRILSLAWTEVGNATGYTLFYAPYPLGEPVASVDMGTARSVQGALPPGAAYYVAIQAYNERSQSDISNIEDFTISEEVFLFPSEEGGPDNIVLASDGSSLVLLESMTDVEDSVLFTDSNGESFTLTLGADGLPRIVVIGEIGLLFSNYTATTVDMAMRTPDGISTAARIGLDSEMSSLMEEIKLRTNDNAFIRFSRLLESSEEAKSTEDSLEDIADGLKLTSKILDAIEHGNVRANILTSRVLNSTGQLITLADAWGRLGVSVLKGAGWALLKEGMKVYRPGREGAVDLAKLMYTGNKCLGRLLVPAPIPAAKAQAILLCGKAVVDAAQLVYEQSARFYHYAHIEEEMAVINAELDAAPESEKSVYWHGSDDSGKANSSISIADLTAFSLSPTSGTAPLEIWAILNPETPLNFNGEGLDFRWTYEGKPDQLFYINSTVFGDGTATSARVVLNHPGTYKISLTVSRHRSGEVLGTSSKTINVTEIAGNSAPLADFEITDSHGNPQLDYYVGDSFRLDENLSENPDGGSVRYRWSTEADGIFFEGPHYVGYFRRPGTLRITLTITDTQGLSGEITKTVNINIGGVEPPDPDPENCTGDDYGFQDNGLSKGCFRLGPGGGKIGVWKLYTSDGNLYRTETYNFSGELHGPWRGNYSGAGESGTYRNGVRIGEWFIYNANGSVGHTHTYENGEVVVVDGVRVDSGSNSGSGSSSQDRPCYQNGILVPSTGYLCDA